MFDPMLTETELIQKYMIMLIMPIVMLTVLLIRNVIIRGARRRK